jgi:hypothetical protein
MQRFFPCWQPNAYLMPTCSIRQLSGVEVHGCVRRLVAIYGEWSSLYGASGTNEKRANAGTVIAEAARQHGLKRNVAVQSSRRIYLNMALET